MSATVDVRGLVDRLRARFADRFPATVAPGTGYQMEDEVRTWRGSAARWRAVKALRLEYEAQWSPRGVRVELAQVVVPPAWRFSGRRLRVMVELWGPHPLAREMVTPATGEQATSTC